VSSDDGAPQAAVVGVAVGEAFELVFDTLVSTRKAVNLRQSPQTAFVFGGWGAGEEQTVQYEGIADRPSGAVLDRVTELYFRVYPDGRERLSWAGLIHVRVRQGASSGVHQVGRTGGSLPLCCARTICMRSLRMASS
jgi:pyridoxine/pyridoxamine 5'-phosphate oxidase